MAGLRSGDRGWRGRERAGDQQVRDGVPVVAAGAMVQHDLVRARSADPPVGIPVELLIALVARGVWTPAEALGHAGQVEFPRGYAPTLVDPAWGLVPEAEPLYRAVLAAARKDGPEALAQAAPVLPEPFRTEAIRDALAGARQRPWEHGAKVLLTSLAPLLPLSLMPDALETVRHTGTHDDRAKAITALAPRLPEHLLPQALSLAVEADGTSRAEALAGLAPYLTGDLAARALPYARAIAEASFRALALAALAPRMPTSMRPEAVAEAHAAVRAIGNEYVYAQALPLLAPALPHDALLEELERARRMDPKEPSLLAGLAACLPEPQRGELLEAAAEALAAMSYPFERAWCAADLAPLLPEVLLEEAIRGAMAACAGEDESLRVEGLRRLALVVPEALAGELLAIAARLEGSGHASNMLERMAPRLPEALLPQALAMVRQMPDAHERAYTVSALAPHLPAALLPEALASLQTEVTTVARITAVASLAGSLAPGARGRHLAPALDAAASIICEAHRKDAVVALAGVLSSDGLAEALPIARAIRSPARRAEALGAVGLQLPRGERRAVLEDALADAGRVEDRMLYRDVAMALAPDLPTGLQRRLQAQARARMSSGDLCELALLLPEPLRRQGLRWVLASARRDRYEDRRALKLRTVVAYLPEDLQPDAWAAALGFRDAHIRSAMLAAVAPRLPQGARAPALAQALAALDETDWEREATRARLWGTMDHRKFRTQALHDLPAHLPEPTRRRVLPEAVVKALKGSYDPDVQVQYEDAVARLAPHLTQEDLRRILALLGARSGAWRARVLGALAPHLRGALRGQAEAEALSVAKRVRGEEDRCELLLWLAGRLPAPLAGQALAGVSLIPDPHALPDDVLERLTRRAPPALYRLWCKTLRSSAAAGTQGVLSAVAGLAPLLAALGGPAAVEQVAEAVWRNEQR